MNGSATTSFSGKRRLPRQCRSAVVMVPPRRDPMALHPPNAMVFAALYQHYRYSVKKDKYPVTYWYHCQAPTLVRDVPQRSFRKKNAVIFPGPFVGIGPKRRGETFGRNARRRASPPCRENVFSKNLEFYAPVFPGSFFIRSSSLIASMRESLSASFCRFK